MTRQHKPTPIASAVAAQMGAAARNVVPAAHAASTETPNLTPEQLAVQTAQAIAKIDQLSTYLRSGEFHDEVAAAVLRRVEKNGSLDATIEAVVNRNLPAITQELRMALGQPPVEGGGAEDPETFKQPIEVKAPPTAEEIMRDNAFELVTGGATIDPETMLIFQVNMPASMRAEDAVVTFFAFEDDHHTHQVQLADGFAQLALQLFNSDQAKFFFGVQYVVRMMTIDHEARALAEAAAALTLDTAANEADPAGTVPPPAPKIC